MPGLKLFGVSFVSCFLLTVVAGGVGCGREEQLAPEPVKGSVARTSPGAGQEAGTAGWIKGSVSGIQLKVKEAVFVWQEKADDMTLILSDRTGLCPLLVAGAMPRGANLLMIMFKHNAPENRDAPFSPGKYPVRRDGQQKQAQDVKAAVLMDLDDTCRPRLEERASLSVDGWVQLDAIAAQAGGRATGSLNLSMGPQRDLLEGRFTAVFCELPRDAPRPTGCK